MIMRLSPLILLSFALLLPEASASGQGFRRVEITEVSRIGGLDGDRALTDVSGLAVTRSGLLLVGQPQARTIAVFRNGRQVRTIGRAGRGPGEFRSIAHVGTVNGLIYGYDPNQLRLVVFDTGGTHVKTWSSIQVDFGPHLVPNAPAHVMGDGTLLVVPTFVNIQESAIESIPVARVSSRGELIKFIARLDWKGPGSAHVNARTRGGRVANLFVPQRVSFNSLFAVDPTGLFSVVVDRAIPDPTGETTFRVIKIDLDGDTVFDRSYKYELKPISDADWRAATAEQRSRLEKLWSSPVLNVPQRELSRALDEAFRKPAFQPGVEEVLIGTDGRIWLKAGSIGSRASRWLSINGDGTPGIYVEVPGSVDVMAFTQRECLTVERGRFDEPYIVTYRFAPGTMKT